MNQIKTQKYKGYELLVYFDGRRGYSGQVYFGVNMLRMYSHTDSDALQRRMRSFVDDRIG